MPDESLFPWNEITRMVFLSGLAFVLAFLCGGAVRLKANENPGKVLQALVALCCAFLFTAPVFAFRWTLWVFAVTLALLMVCGALGGWLGFRTGVFLPLGSAGLEFAFAKRISFRSQRSVSGLIVVLGILSIALGVAVMEVSVSILFGFKREIQNKIVGFGSHLQVGDILQSYESNFTRLPLQNDFVPAIRKLPEVKSVSPYLYLPGMLKQNASLEGVVMKGVNADYDWTFFKSNLKEGRLPELGAGEESREVLISRKLSNLLQLKSGDKAFFYYFEDKPRVRKVEVAGVYETGMDEFDAVNVLCDLRMLQRIAGFEADQVMGFEINLRDLESLEDATWAVNDLLPGEYHARPITEVYPELFDWLELQHQNVWAIIFLMVLIAVINIVTVILILILERTRTVGMLKAMGMPGFRISRIFVGNGFILTLAGLAIGNLIAMALILLQEQTGLLHLDQESYFVSVVPVRWVWDRFFLINLGVAGVCLLAAWLPSLVVRKISPLEAIRFE